AFYISSLVYGAGIVCHVANLMALKIEYNSKLSIYAGYDSLRVGTICFHRNAICRHNEEQL
ncbi:MAG TPA: hypothetical protein VIN08_09085, partial [Ohtaekwangia sp.]|uniref:hypothetical protein n=1 Tax=Ohtaekwangia sp. TaxID=2066019 RepID=UPI002F9462B2